MATVDDIIDTVSPSLQQQHQQQPFTAVRRLSKDFDYEPPIAESSGDDADHHRPSGLSFKFLKKGSAVSKYSKRSMNVSSDSLNFRSNPDLSSGQEAGTFGASGSSAFVTHLKDEDSTHHSNSELSNTLATSMANRKTKLGKVFAGSLFGKGGGESSQSSLNSLKRGDLVSRSTHSLADSAKSIDRNPRARAAVFGSGTHKSMESLQDLNNTRRSSFEQSDEEDAGKSRSSMDSLRITRSLVPPPPSLHQQQLSIVTSERKELTQPLGEARATSTSPVLPPPPPPPIGSGVSASSEEKSPDSLNLFSNTTAILPEVSLLGSIIPPTYEINAKRDLIERLQKERFEIRDQLKQVERAGFGSYSKDKQRNLQLMNTGLKVELDGLFKERRALELQVLENIISVIIK